MNTYAQHATMRFVNVHPTFPSDVVSKLSVSEHRKLPKILKADGTKSRKLRSVTFYTFPLKRKSFQRGTTSVADERKLL